MRNFPKHYNQKEIDKRYLKKVVLVEEPTVEVVVVEEVMSKDAVIVMDAADDLAMIK